MDKFCTACGQALVGQFCTGCGKSASAVATTEPYSQKAARSSAVLASILTAALWYSEIDRLITDWFEIPRWPVLLAFWAITLAGAYQGSLQQEAYRRVADGGTFTTR